MSRRKPPDTFRPKESPIVWFREMLLAVDRGDFHRAAESQRQLDRLGWQVTQKRTRQFIVAYLWQGEQVLSGELEHVRRSRDELSEENLDSSDVHKVLKPWLPDLVRAMRDATDRYQMRRTRGLQHQLQEALGSPVLKEEHVNGAQKEAPTISIRLMDGMNWVEKISRLVEHMMKAVGVVTKAIEYFSGTSSPSPPSK